MRFHAQLLLALALAVVASCGVKAPPLPPEPVTPQQTENARTPPTAPSPAPGR